MFWPSVVPFLSFLIKFVLQDVLAICGGTLPSWCSQLLFSCKFLFPFDIRRRYFYCTAFGLARALHHLQQLHNAEGGSAPNMDREARELRVGRLTRQKVCVVKLFCGCMFRSCA